MPCFMEISLRTAEKARSIRKTKAYCKKAYGTKTRVLTAAHGVEKLGVRLGGLQLVDQEFGRFELVHGKEELSQHPDLLQDRRFDQQFLAPCARPVHVDGGVDAL